MTRNKQGCKPTHTTFIACEQAPKWGKGRRGKLATGRVEGGIGAGRKKGSLWTFFGHCRLVIPDSGITL